MSVAISPACAADGAIAALAAWLIARGAWLSPKLELDCGDGGHRAVRVASGELLKPGEVAASVPLSLLVTQAVALEAEPTLGEHLRGTDLMAAFMVRQRAAGGEWQPFVAALPQNVSTTLVWSAAELSELQASDLALHSDSRARAVARHHALLPGEPFGLDEFGWALSMVWSRGHQVNMGAGREGALAPLLDLFDHDARPHCRAAAVEAGALVARAQRAAAAGERVTVPYGAGGPLSNARLLLDYGFCLADNPSDDVAPQLEAWLGANAQQLLADAPALGFLRAALQRRAAEYATSLEEDEALLRAAPAEEGEARRLCALRVRLAEKQILRSWAEWAARQLSTLPPAGVAAPLREEL